MFVNSNYKNDVHIVINFGSYTINYYFRNLYKFNKFSGLSLCFWIKY